MNTKIFPKLNSDAYLKKFSDYVIAYNSNPNDMDIMHPSHAMLLSLANGSYSTEDLHYLFSETYNIPISNAKEITDTLFIRMKNYLTFSDNPSEEYELKYDPKSFIYNPNKEIFDSVKDNTPLPVPTSITIIPSLKCNFDCSYCYQNTSNRDDNLTLTNCLDIIEEAAKYNVIYISISGGEPTLFNGWIKMLERTIQLNMIPVITTNGYILGKNPDLINQLEQIGLKNITVSLDASYSELHSKITNTSNTFDYVLKAIKSLVQKDIRVSIKCVLTNDNFENLNDFIDFTASLGVKEIGISYKEFGSNGSNANELDNISEEKINKAYEIISYKNKKYKGVCSIHPPKNPYKKWGENDWVNCGALSVGLVIFPDGNISICEKLYGMDNFYCGNIHSQTLEEVWTGDILKSLQAHSADPHMVDSDCGKCKMLKKCRTGCFVDSYNHNGNFFSKQPSCSGPF